MRNGCQSVSGVVWVAVCEGRSTAVTEKEFKRDLIPGHPLIGDRKQNLGGCSGFRFARLSGRMRELGRCACLQINPLTDVKSVKGVCVCVLVR